MAARTAAPRTVQFRDAIEIPVINDQNSKSNQEARRNSWDPNLTDVKLCFFVDDLLQIISFHF